MRLQDFTRYIDFNAISDGIDKLQGKLGELREALPEARQIRDKLPGYGDIRKRLPFAPASRRGSYTLPAALILGGAAVIAAVAITSIAVRDAKRHAPKRNEDMA